MLIAEEKAARRTWEYSNKSSQREKDEFILQRLHNKIWHFVKSLGVMPALIHRTHDDLYGLYLKSRTKCNCTLWIKKVPCKCETKMLFQAGCQCGGC